MEKQNNLSLQKTADIQLCPEGKKNKATNKTKEICNTLTRNAITFEKLYLLSNLRLSYWKALKESEWLSELTRSLLPALAGDVHSEGTPGSSTGRIWFCLFNISGRSLGTSRLPGLLPLLVTFWTLKIHKLSWMAYLHKMEKAIPHLLKSECNNQCLCT